MPGSQNLDQSRHFWPAVAVLLAIIALTLVTSARREAQTLDEGAHLAAGYSYLKTGDFRLNPAHPPLSKVLSALLLVPLNPALPLNAADWSRADEYKIGKAFLYRNRVPADTLLLAGRSATMGLTLLLGLAIAVCCRKYFGSAAAVFSLALFSFDPNILAHGRYVTSDICVTLLIFLSCLKWQVYLENGNRWALVTAGLCTGLAVGAKFSALVLYPIFLVLYRKAPRVKSEYWQTAGFGCHDPRAIVRCQCIVCL
jgi:predicted membrane-bound dolichyl-phosphate-mannose-protein mannosyltransferase